MRVTASFLTACLLVQAAGFPSAGIRTDRFSRAVWADQALELPVAAVRHGQDHTAAAITAMMARQSIQGSFTIQDWVAGTALESLVKWQPKHSARGIAGTLWIGAATAEIEVKIHPGRLEWRKFILKNDAVRRDYGRMLLDGIHRWARAQGLSRSEFKLLFPGSRSYLTQYATDSAEAGAFPIGPTEIRTIAGKEYETLTLDLALLKLPPWPDRYRVPKFEPVTPDNSQGSRLGSWTEQNAPFIGSGLSLIAAAIVAQPILGRSFSIGVTFFGLAILAVGRRLAEPLRQYARHSVERFADFPRFSKRPPFAPQVLAAAQALPSRVHALIDTIAVGMIWIYTFVLDFTVVSSARTPFTPYERYLLPLELTVLFLIYRQVARRALVSPQSSSMIAREA